jgi:hypothetical protein
LKELRIGHMANIIGTHSSACVGEGLRGIFVGDCDDGCEKLASTCGWKDVFDGLQSDVLASLANREDVDMDESSDSD